VNDDPAVPADDTPQVTTDTPPVTTDDTPPVTTDDTTPVTTDGEVTVLADPTLIVAPSTTQPSTPDVKTPEPTTPDVKTPEVKTPEPTATEPKNVAPTTPDVKTPVPSTPDVKTPDLKVAEVPVPQPKASIAPATQPAAVGMISHGLDADGSVSMVVNKSVILTSKVLLKRVSNAQPDTVAVQMFSPSEIMLTAKKAGSTQLVLWDDQEHSQVVDVVVGFDLRGLEAQIKEMFPKGNIKVESANGVIVLRGHVPDLQTATKAAAVAAPYGSGGANSSVLNFLEVSGGQQVMLQVRFAEVTRTVQQSLGFNAFITDGKFALGAGNGPFGAAPTLANAGTNSTFPVYGGALAGNASFEYFVNALRQNGLLRILAEPNLTAISGQQASFLAGGEIPILVPQASGGGSVTTVEYKQYGIQLNFTPTVLGDGRVRLQCTPQVSDLDFAHAVNLGGEPVPALTTRNVNTTVELAEGQTFALAGLLKNEVTANKNITPLLGDMPIIGELFRSVSYNRQETELVVLVTPHMVEAMNPNQVPRLPGDPWRDPTEAQLFLSGDLGGQAPDVRHAPTLKSSRFYGTTGFNPAPLPPNQK
jgi:pilus assembly protein CpaC